MKDNDKRHLNLKKKFQFLFYIYISIYAKF